VQSFLNHCHHRRRNLAQLSLKQDLQATVSVNIRNLDQIAKPLEEHFDGQSSGNLSRQLPMPGLLQIFILVLHVCIVGVRSCWVSLAIVIGWLRLGRGLRGSGCALLHSATIVFLLLCKAWAWGKLCPLTIWGKRTAQSQPEESIHSSRLSISG